jgi:RNA polymerase sigma-70 factor (ECF subfamily)
VDRALIERARAGDRDAFAVLVGSRVDRCFATARIILGDADRAHDAVQEALVRCWRDLPSLREPDRFDGWLRRLLMHAITDEFRRGRRFAARVQVLHEHPTTRDEVSMVDDRDQIDRALQGISVDHRTILTLYYLHGLPIADVADALGIPAGTAKSRLHYAMQAIRAELAARERIATTKVSA